MLGQIRKTLARGLPTWRSNRLPKRREVEISLFGRGVGECLALHVGEGEWCIVDSFPGSSHPSIALDYLTDIGVPVSSVSLILATHWHDDHIQGLADTVAACTNAMFACSAALDVDEFFELVEARSVPS